MSKLWWLVIGAVVAVVMVAGLVREQQGQQGQSGPRQICDQESAAQGSPLTGYSVFRVEGKAVGVTCDLGSPAQINIYVQY